MKLVFATSGELYWKFLLENKVQNILHSFAYKDTFLRALQEHDVKNKFLMIDSGAFTAWTKKTAINLDEYIEFCKFLVKKYPENKWIPINLDVIPGEFGKIPTDSQIEYSASKGWENYEYMLGKGIKPVHIFHQHEDFKWLHKLMKSSDYIGISPDNSQSVQSRVEWLKRVFSVVRDKVKTHGFACTGNAFVKSVPFYSADSSSWIVGPRYGIVTYFDPKTISIKMIHLSDIRTDRVEFNRFKSEVFPIISKHIHVNMMDIVKAKESTKFLLKCAIIAQQQLEIACTRLWEKRGIVFTT